MRQTRQQLMQLRRQTRTQMLAALTPEHKALVATVVGQLAIAPDPDPRAAAQQLDNALSAAEKQAILKLGETLRTSSRSLMEAERTRMEATLSPDERARIAQRQDRMKAQQTAHPRTPDAGITLLGILSGGMHRFGGPDGPGGPGWR